MRQMSVTELQKYLESTEPAPLLLDIREPWEYGICHLKGSRLVPMRQIPGTLADLDPEQEVVVICHHGIRSRQVAQFMYQQGFSRIINMEGGMAAWSQYVDRDVPTY